MEDLYGLHSSTSCSDDVLQVGNLMPTAMPSGLHSPVDNLFQFNPAETKVNGSDVYDLTKAQIANHPLYPNLVSAYLECRKVGAPPDMASFLEDISKENHLVCSHNEIGADPELDEFMESYCEVLHKFKDEISKQFDEATAFLNNMESQLNSLCSETPTTKTSSPLTSGNYHSDEASGTSEEDLSCEEMEVTETQESTGAPPANREVKEMLLQKYSGYLSSLRKEFLKKRKKGKLPKDARAVLLEWWNVHYRWPYPTEEEKMKLSEITGLDPKQINNWFINQRKRHWRPSEDMRFALMGGVSSSFGGPTYYDVEGGNTNVDF